MTLDSQDSRIVSRLLFFISLGIWIAIKVLQKSYILSVLGIAFDFFAVRVVLLAVLLLREVLFGRWDRRAFIGLVVFAAMAIIAYHAHWNHLVDGALLIFFARNIPFRQLALFCFVEIAVLVCLVLIAAGVGLIPDFVFTSTATSPRHALGFTWVNTAGSFVFYLSCLWVFLRGEKFRVWEALPLLIVAVLLFLATRSRAAFVASIVLALLAIVLPQLGCRFGKTTAFKAICVSAIAAIAIVAIGLACLYDPSVPWMSQLDFMLSHRLSLAHNNIVEDGITLLGQRLDFGAISHYNAAGELVAGNAKDLVDCLYAKLLVHCGVLFLALSLVMCTVASARIVDAGRWGLLAAVVAIALHAVFEPFAGYLFFDPFLFLLGSLFGCGADDVMGLRESILAMEEATYGKHAIASERIERYE